MNPVAPVLVPDFPRKPRCRLIFFSPPFFIGKQADKSQRPDAESQTGYSPAIPVMTSIACDEAAEDGIEEMDERSCRDESSRLHIRLDEIESGEITQKR